MRMPLPNVLLLSAAIAGCVFAAPAPATPTFSVPDRDLAEPLVLVAYGDMRFTAPAETDATNPAVRQALVLGRHRDQGHGHRARHRRLALAGKRAAHLARESNCVARSRGSLRSDRLAPSARGRRAVDQGDQPQPAPERTCAGRLSESGGPAVGGAFRRERRPHPQL